MKYNYALAMKIFEENGIRFVSFGLFKINELIAFGCCRINLESDIISMNVIDYVNNYWDMSINYQECNCCYL